MGTYHTYYLLMDCLPYRPNICRLHESSIRPGFILARVVCVKNENGQKFTRKK